MTDGTGVKSEVWRWRDQVARLRNGDVVQHPQKERFEGWGSR